MSNKLLLFAAILVCCACTSKKEVTDFYSTELFKQVQLAAIFPDSKTFTDCVPKRDLKQIMEDYDQAKGSSDFDLKTFVLNNFDLPIRPQSNFHADTTRSMEAHIHELWPVLTRKPDDFNSRSSLMPLPLPYIVPGGRFSEVYYWDSYFTMLGLAADGQHAVQENMVSNFSHLIDSVGFVPNGNRAYYKGRSQPPFFSLMVDLLAERDSMALVRYQQALIKEYNFWMNGTDQLKKPGDAYEHVVMMPDGSIMNRYYDRIPEPRPEAYKEDVEIAKKSGREPKEVYSDLRAAAESGWDFSSRWCAIDGGLETIRTTQIVPVDLNSLLYNLEKTIALSYELKKNEQQANRYHQLAVARQKAVLSYCWSKEKHFFYDYNFKEQKLVNVKSLAATFPLFFNLVNEEMARAVATVLEEEFLKPGGLVTTLNATGQQWDSPNGWAPLQWMAYKGLSNYKQDKLAQEIKTRWIKQNKRVFKATGKMMEKYNVMDTTLLAGGGEYPNQDGFGWTNGVALALIKEKRIHNTLEH